MDPDLCWLRGAMAADQSAGLEPVVSVHPAMSCQLLGYPQTQEPVEGLISRARVLISRPSTLIPQALRIGVQPFLLAVPEDNLYEFADPLGAYDLSLNAAELTNRIRTFLDGRSNYSHQHFLARHTDENAHDPAYRRIARAILSQIRIT